MHHMSIQIKQPAFEVLKYTQLNDSVTNVAHITAELEINFLFPVLRTTALIYQKDKLVVIKNL